MAIDHCFGTVYAIMTAMIVMMTIRPASVKPASALRLELGVRNIVVHRRAGGFALHVGDARCDRVTRCVIVRRRIGIRLLGDGIPVLSLRDRILRNPLADTSARARSDRTGSAVCRRRSCRWPRACRAGPSERRLARLALHVLDLHDRDAGEHADDRDDDHQLDEREAADDDLRLIEVTIRCTSSSRPA